MTIRKVSCFGYATIYSLDSIFSVSHLFIIRLKTWVNPRPHMGEGWMQPPPGSFIIHPNAHNRDSARLKGSARTACADRPSDSQPAGMYECMLRNRQYLLCYKKAFIYNWQNYLHAFVSSVGSIQFNHRQRRWYKAIQPTVVRFRVA